MKPEAQRIAIAKSCGWKACEYQGRAGGYVAVGPSGKSESLLGDTPELALLRNCPDYLHDLNAMRAAEQSAWQREWSHRDVFVDKLARILNPVHGYRMQDGADLLDATASQRAEAFLRTLNLWTE